jgi:hypothetical protein
MVHCSITVSECIKIHSWSSANFRSHGTIIKLTAKCIAVALDTYNDTPLHQQECIYVLPKNLHILDSDEYDSDDYPQPYYGDYDPEALWWYPYSKSNYHSDSESLSESPYSKEFYEELMLLGIQFLEDIQELILQHSRDVCICPDSPST